MVSLTLSSTLPGDLPVYCSPHAAIFECARHTPDSEPLPLLFSLPTKPLPKISTWLSPYPPSGLCSEIVVSRRIFLTTLCKTATPPLPVFFFFLSFFLKFYLFLVALGLRCCARAFSSCGKRGLLFIAVHGLLIAVASLVAEHGL